MVLETQFLEPTEQNMEGQAEIDQRLEMLREAKLEGRRVVSYKDAILGVNGGTLDSSYTRMLFPRRMTLKMMMLALMKMRRILDTGVDYDP
ncbi:Fe-S protein assembly chaperone HscA [Sesbania bispinosa]|nr:Fe-S protein assembly chaperone HscA [Sesbania bispinosa]